MFNPQLILIKHFVKDLRDAYEHTYGLRDPEYGRIIAWVGSMALENIANTDMLYHNLEHTIMVSLAGQQILIGKQLSEGGVDTVDWLHYMIAVICHDIGYIKGICRQDTDTACVTGAGEGTVEMEHGGTDANLSPYHVDRGKLFIKERFGDNPIIDADLVCDYIEMTRFPPPDDEFHKQTDTYGGLVRAADLIGQLGDPGYLRKIPALYYEFEAMGANEKMGYGNPSDMRNRYAKFYWNVVRDYIEDGLRYLRVTQQGKQWIANLHSHVFAVEHSEE